MSDKILVFKFGGASVQDAEAVTNIPRILSQRGTDPVIVVVSAMGKMTNELEVLTRLYVSGEDTTIQFQKVVDYHTEIAAALFAQGHEVFTHINDLFVEIEWMIEETPDASYDYLYDQIVSVGELLSTRIVSAYLSINGIDNLWCDARDIVKTDNAYREARVDIDQTAALVKQTLMPEVHKHGVVVTQGFIGCTSENFSSTLGREGSDYTAALLANMVDAAEVTIWKDVPGIMTADPKQFDDTVRMDRISYREAIEMTYYGAKVLHPKTIKPLQNKSIPLRLKSFMAPDDEGTLVGAELQTSLPPVIVLAENQVMVHFSTKDYSFVAEEHLSEIFECFARNRVKINLMRNTAISFTVCCRHSERKLGSIERELGDKYNIAIDPNLQLITVRHANDEALRVLLAGKVVMFEERFMDTVQCVVKEHAIPRPRS